MNSENTLKLFDLFPRLYRGRLKPVDESMMTYGFESCGDGWFDVLFSLSKVIEDIAKQEGIDLQDDQWPEVSQVKQKFGRLCFHVENASQAMMDSIEDAVETARQTCQVCGAFG